MGRLLVTIVAKLLGRDPEAAWESTVKWTVLVLLGVITVTLSFAITGYVLGDKKESGSTLLEAPASQYLGPPPTLDPYLTTHWDAQTGLLAGMSDNLPPG